VWLSSVTIQDFEIDIYKPDGSLFFTQLNFNPSSTLFTITNLPVTGTYTLVVVPSGTYTGNVTMSAGAPDLSVTTMSQPSSPISPNLDGTYSVPISWTVQNIGPNTATPNPTYWQDVVYLSASGVKDANSIDIAHYNKFGTLAPSASYSPNITATAPSSLAPGVYYVLVSTDDQNTLVEAGKANNIRAAASTVTFLGLSDLTVTSITVPTSPIAKNGDGSYSIPLTWTVQNIGQSSVINNNWWDAAVLNNTPSFTGYECDLGAVRHNGPLAAGASYTTSATLTCSSVAAGNYYVVFNADNTGNVTEASESNNALASSTQITLQP
jgi:hypothetical protein